MSADHTPGPWLHLSHRQIAADLVIDQPVVCEVFSHMGADEADANMALIAAAPELLECLTVLESHCRLVHRIYNAEMERARAAIRKAEGRAA